MEENTVQTLVAFEIAQPRKRLNRSAGAVYFLLTVLVLAVISVANFAATHWQIPREWVQLPLYAILIAASILVYRRHYVCYRYTLTDQTFAVDRIAGNRERTMAAIDLSEIDDIRGDHEGDKPATHAIYASVLARTHILHALPVYRLRDRREYHRSRLDQSPPSSAPGCPQFDPRQRSDPSVYTGSKHSVGDRPEYLPQSI